MSIQVIVDVSFVADYPDYFLGYEKRDAFETFCGSGYSKAEAFNDALEDLAVSELGEKIKSVNYVKYIGLGFPCGQEVFGSWLQFEDEALNEISNQGDECFDDDSAPDFLRMWYVSLMVKFEEV